MFDLSDPTKSVRNPQLLRWMPGFYRAPIGECLVDWEYGWIRALNVYAGYQNQGNGKKILTDLMRLAKLRNVELLWGMIPTENARACRLFEGLGFKVETFGKAAINRVWVEL